MAVTIFIIGYLLILSFYDCREKAVPIFLLWAGGVVIAVYQIYEALFGDFIWNRYLAERFWAMMPGIILLMMAWITKKAGGADGIVFLFLGVLLEYRRCILVFICSLFLTALFSGGLLLLRRGNKNTRVPYLPFLTASYLLGILIR